MNKNKCCVGRFCTFNLPKVLLYYILYYILSLLFISNAAAQSEVYLSIRAGGTGLTGVGIGGFESPAGATDMATVQKTLGEDLDKSGFFHNSSLEDSLANMPGGIFAKWTAAGAKYFLFGEEAQGGNSVNVKLYDLKTAAVLLNEEYMVEKSRPWYTAHVIVDDMIQLFRGTRGSLASQIAYIRKVNANSDEIFLIDADGRRPRQLTFSRTMTLSPDWSIDGSSVVYSSLNVNAWLIMTINVNTGQSLDISSWSGFNTSPSFSRTQPDLVAFTSTRDGNAEIYSSRINGGGLRRLTNHPLIDSSPSWSPDDSRIVFSSDRTGKPLLYVMNSDGSNLHRFTSSLNAYEDSPSWSPDGSRVVFVMMSEYGSFDIATASATGENVVILTYSDGSNEDPYWSPDGLRIVFSSTRGGNKRLYIMNSDGSDVRPLTVDGNCYSPAWAPAVSGNDIRVTSDR